MHFVHKLFAGRCTWQKNEILPSQTPSVISLSIEGANAGNVDGYYSKSAPKKNEIGLGPLALPPFNPARHQDGPSDLGLGRN
jgi:hypothetical protein